jgi:hypothetical protein
MMGKVTSRRVESATVRSPTFQSPVGELIGGGRGIRTPGDFRLNGFQDGEIALPYPHNPFKSRHRGSFRPANPSQLGPNDGQNDGQDAT